MARQGPWEISSVGIVWWLIDKNNLTIAMVFVDFWVMLDDADQVIKMCSWSNYLILGVATCTISNICNCFVQKLKPSLFKNSDVCSVAFGFSFSPLHGSLPFVLCIETSWFTYVCKLVKVMVWCKLSLCMFVPVKVQPSDQRAGLGWAVDLDILSLIPH